MPSEAELLVWDRSVPLVEAVQGVHVVLPSNAGLDRASMECARELKLVQQPAVGTDGIDLGAARERGIPVCNAPGTNPKSVAETALLLILALARRLREAEKKFTEARIGEPLGVELCDKTLLIVGMGQSGSRLGRACESLGMRVLGARSSTPRAELLEMCTQADFVSVHCPLNDATRGLIGAEVIAAMKPGAMLVNCSRGALLERSAVSDALATNKLGGLGLDVYWREPWDPADPLFARENVITLPHIAGSTVEAFARIADIVAENTRRVFAGEPLLHRIA
ncbi:MAG: glycerate dehydrogenase [Polyangiaceae bacterium]|nr:glycerate dehydrogenase [Polyangiaceae bacterium]